MECLKNLVESSFFNVIYFEQDRQKKLLDNVSFEEFFLYYIGVAES